MSELGRDDLLKRLGSVGEHLAVAGEQVAIVIVGGAALNLGGYLTRTTQDVDVYARIATAAPTAAFVSAQPLPDALARAASKVARDFRLPENWINARVSPPDLSDPPPRFAEELQWLQLGGLRVGIVGRSALIALKLHAAVDRDDRSVHYQDLLALRPTDRELAEASAWVARQDIGSGFDTLVAAAVAQLRRRRDG